MHTSRNELQHILLINYICTLLIVQKYKDYDILNYNFACCFVWV